MKWHTPSLHSLRDVSPTPLRGASPVTGETPATAIARMAGFAAVWRFAFYAVWVARSATNN